MTNRPTRLLCLQCGEEADATGGLRGCPSCGDREHVPADLDDTVTVTLTRHELRILTIWASNWGDQCGSPEATQVICDRLAQQTDAALTMSQEVADLRAAFGGDNVQVFGPDGQPR